jgi:hypothetical protein
MSNLSTAECTAGISRSALAATLKKHGSNGDTPHAPKVPTVQLAAKDSTRDPFSGTRETLAIDTPYRKLSILESRDGEIVLRDASFIGNKCDLALVHLEREPARSLAVALLKIAHGGEA